MFDRLNIKALLKAPRAAGLRIKLLKSGQPAFQLVSIARKKKEIEIETVNETVNSIDNLPADEAGKLPLCISIDGKGILHKLLEIETDTEDAQLVGKMLPNAHPKDFYLQRIALSNGKTWVSMARKTVVDDMLNQLAAKGWFPHDIILGNFALVTAAAALESESTELTFHDEESTVLVQNNELTALKAKADEQPMTEHALGEKKVSTAGLVAMGNAIQYYLSDPRIARPSPDMITEKTNAFFHKRLFVQMGWAALAFFMLTLLISFLTFDHYSKKYQEVASEVRQHEAMFTQLQQLKEEFKLKQHFIAQSGFVNASHISYYADQIALTLPKSIKLEQLTINPPAKRKKENEALSFQFNEINVTGFTHENLDLNSWIKQLKAQDWVKEIVIVNLLQGKSKNGGTFTFRIKVNKTLV
jgi:Tfp pilus assembly protein PilN